MPKDLLEKLGAVGLDDLRKAVGVVKKTADHSDVLADDKSEMLMRSFADEALDVVRDRGGIKVTDQICAEGLPASVLEMVTDPVVRETILAYEKALERLCSLPQGDDPFFAKLKEYKQKHIAWSVMQPTAEVFRTMEYRNPVEGYLVVLPPGHYVLERQNEIITLRGESSAVTIRPNVITEVTRAAKMVFSLIGLQTNPYNKMSIGVTNNDMHNACPHEAQIAAVNIMTQGRLSSISRTALLDLKIRSVEQILDMATNENLARTRAGKLLERYLKLIFKDKVTYYESTIRAGILTTSMALTLIKDSTTDRAEILGRLAEFNSRIRGVKVDFPSGFASS